MQKQELTTDAADEHGQNSGVSIKKSVFFRVAGGFSYSSA
jgi:hypothetical protein